MNWDRQIVEAGIGLATAIGARALITFVADVPCGPFPIPVLSAGELPLGPGASTLEGLRDVLLERLAKAAERSPWKTRRKVRSSESSRRAWWSSTLKGYGLGSTSPSSTRWPHVA